MHWGSTRLRQIGAQLLAHLVLLGGLLLIRGTSGAAEVGLNKLQRPFLVMAVAGDHSQHENSWLDDRGHRNWDLLLIYYGSNEDFACVKQHWGSFCLPAATLPVDTQPPAVVELGRSCRSLQVPRLHRCGAWQGRQVAPDVAAH